MLILGIETCLPSASIFLGKEGKVLSSSTLVPQSSSEHLLPLINCLLEETNLTINRMEALVVSKGPGSFTGVRIGVSLAKALSFSLSLPLVGVPTLDCIAFSLPFSGLICSLIPAYRSSFFAAFFYKQGKNLRRASDYLFLPLEKIITRAQEFSPQKALFVPLPRGSISEAKLTPKFSFFQKEVYLDKALLKWALEDIKNGRTVDPLRLTPVYVSTPIINRGRQQR